MIIGLTGPICSGKDEVAKLLSEMGFTRLSLSDEIRAEMRAKGIELTRSNLQEYADNTRRKEGAGAWARKIMARLQNDKNYVIDSIRNPGEIEELRQLGNFFLIKVYAPARMRFSRMVKRNRGQDPQKFEDFEKLEMKDLGIGQPDYGQQHAQCFALADKTIINEGSIEKLKEKANEIVGELKALASSWTSSNNNEPTRI